VASLGAVAFAQNEKRLDFLGGELVLSQEELRQLAATFHVTETDIQAELDKYRSAAEEEYLRMILGQRVLTRGQDIREYRLFLLIIHVFDSRLPSETQISALFQTTATQSRSLLRAVMSKYQYELQESINGTLAQLLRDSQPDPNVKGGRWLTVDSENIIEALNRKVAAIDGSLRQVVKLRGTVSTYEISPSTFKRLTELLP
jgi:hypothetical protein